MRTEIDIEAACKARKRPRRNFLTEGALEVTKKELAKLKIEYDNLSKQFQEARKETDLANATVIELRKALKDALEKKPKTAKGQKPTEDQKPEDSTTEGNTTSEETTEGTDGKTQTTEPEQKEQPSQQPPAP